MSDTVIEVERSLVPSVRGRLYVVLAEVACGGRIVTPEVYASCTLSFQLFLAAAGLDKTLSTFKRKIELADAGTLSTRSSN